MGIWRLLEAPGPVDMLHHTWKKLPCKGLAGRNPLYLSNTCQLPHTRRVHIPPLSLDMYDDDLNTCNLKLCVLPSQPAGAFSATVTLSSRAATALSSESNTAEAHRFGSPIQPLLYGSCTLLVLPRDACQELQHGLFPRMCAAVEQEVRWCLCCDRGSASALEMS
eukprot:1152588-Pelagomonas_calceolata.AAC.12